VLPTIVEFNLMIFFCRPSLTEVDEYNHKKLPEIPSVASTRPPPIPEGPPLDIQDVEFADASDNENDSLIPDEMTADEAEKLLSSR
jgi:neurabin